MIRAGLRDKYVGEILYHDLDYGLLILNPYNMNNGTLFRDHIWIPDWHESIPACGSQITFYGTTFWYTKEWRQGDEPKRKVQLGLTNISIVSIKEPVKQSENGTGSV